MIAAVDMYEIDRLPELSIANEKRATRATYAHLPLSQRIRAAAP